MTSVRAILKNTAVSFAVFLVMACLIACGGPDSSADRASANASQGLKPGMPMLLELGSVTCIPCQKMAPVLEKLELEYGERLQIEFHDVRKSPAVGRAWGVMTIPTQVFLDAGGREVFRHMGYLSYEEIVKILADMGI